MAFSPFRLGRLACGAFRCFYWYYIAGNVSVKRGKRGDSGENVPHSVRAEGHRIVAVTPLEEYVKLLVERGT